MPETTTQPARIAAAIVADLDPDLDFSMCLDEWVHDVAQEAGVAELNAIDDEEAQDAHITAIEDAASDINNGGLEAQIRYLIESGVASEEIEAKLARLSRIADGLFAEGFDESYVLIDGVKAKCSECQALVINGLACHEIGCRNQPRDDDEDFEQEPEGDLFDEDD